MCPPELMILGEGKGTLKEHMNLWGSFGGDKDFAIRPCAVSCGALVNRTEGYHPVDLVLMPAFWVIHSTGEGSVNGICILPASRECSHEQHLLYGKTLCRHYCSLVKRESAGKKLVRSISPYICTLSITLCCTVEP